MRKTLLMSMLMCIAFLSCQKQQLTPFETAMLSDPIKPVMLGSDSTSIVLADYIPTLLDESFTALFDHSELPFPNGCLKFSVPDMIDPTKGHQVHFINIKQGTNTIAIPALTTTMMRKQAMYSVSATANSITLSFTEQPQNPRFAVLWQNIALETDMTEAEGQYTLTFQNNNCKKGRSFLRVYAIDAQYLYNDLLIPLQDMQPLTDAASLTRHDQQAMVLYSLMVDRFENGNTENDWHTPDADVMPIVDYMGGDIKGITNRINQGFFNELGVSTIWISPITQNPYSSWGYYAFNFLPNQADDAEPLYDNKYNRQLDHSRFTGYHGYWPILTTQLDRRLGTDKEFEQMLSAAHKHNLNVILDYVANHVHIESPILRDHPDWITDSILPDGRRNFELWDDERLTTWFDKHIPTLDLERTDVYQPMTDSALLWLSRFELDGFRHDACKHIPECYWRTLTQKMKTQFPDRPLWMIGETYGSPELINSYVKTGMLDAQFDFNVYFTAIHAIADPYGDMLQLNQVIQESLAAYGAHHTMGNISGNHDQVRFISLAGGAVRFDEDGKEAGWTRDITVGDNTVAYKRAMLLEALNLTIPGVPCIYQGDEYGQPGGGDPDNRKMMRFSGLNDQETDMRNEVISLIKQRRSSMPLMYGDYFPLYVTSDVLCFKRIYMNEQVIVAINTAPTPQTFEAEGETINLEPYSYVVR